MAWHCTVDGSDLSDPAAHLAAGIEVLNDALADAPEKLRYHVCWGNYKGPHHKDASLREIVDLVLKTNAKSIYVEGANPQHEHESGGVEAGRAPRRQGSNRRRDRRQDQPRRAPGAGGTAPGAVSPMSLARSESSPAPTVGFATFVGFNSCHPAAAWLKLHALVEGARIASERLY